MITKTHFEISASWMQACGFGDSAKIVKVLKIENHGNGREVVTVEHPCDSFHSEWVVCPFMGGRGQFVDAPKPVKTETLDGVICQVKRPSAAAKEG